MTTDTEPTPPTQAHKSQSNEGCQANNADELLLAFLAHRDVLCPECKYNLRNTTGNRCPECNEPMELRVHLPERIIGRWVASLATACIGLGGPAAITLIVCTFDPESLLEETKGHVVLGFDVFFGLSVALLIKSRERFYKLASNRQTMILNSLIAFLVIELVAFVATIR